MKQYKYKKNKNQNKDKGQEGQEQEQYQEEQEQAEELRSGMFYCTRIAETARLDFCSCLMCMQTLPRINHEFNEMTILRGG